jgi:DNA-directed RNA polymerase subunit RPC12/RpoP
MGTIINPELITKDMAGVDDKANLHPSWNNYPELFAELDFSKNSNLTFRGKPIKVWELACGTNKKLDWKCFDCKHEWKAKGNDRKYGRGCPACDNKIVHVDGRNSMSQTHPELAIEYIGDATKTIAGTHKKLDWKCSTCGHEWKAVGSNRSRGAGCSACAGQVIHSDGRNSMANTHPELAVEYQGDANIILAGTNKKLDWKCSACGHEWKAVGSNRSRGAGCPNCAESGYNPSSIGYVYIHHYQDSQKSWLKCGITNYPSDRIKSLKSSAKKLNIEVTELELYTFADGYNAKQCEADLLSMKGLRFDSGYEVDGKNEFFRYESLDEIKKLILNWL